jgi:hypothetical protein
MGLSIQRDLGVVPGHLDRNTLILRPEAFQIILVLSSEWRRIQILMHGLPKGLGVAPRFFPTQLFRILIDAIVMEAIPPWSSDWRILGRLSSGIVVGVFIFTHDEQPLW